MVFAGIYPVEGEDYGELKESLAFELRGDIYMQSKTYEFAEKDYSMFLDMEP